MSSIDGIMTDDEPLPAFEDSTTAGSVADSNDPSYLQSKCGFLQKQLENLQLQQQKRKDQRRKEKEEIKSSFSAMKAYIDQLEKEYSQLAIHVKKLMRQADKKETEEANSDSSSDIEEMKLKIKALKLENEQLKSREKELEKERDDLGDKYKSLEETVGDMRDTEMNLKERVRNIDKVVDLIPMDNNAPKRQTDASIKVLADASTASSHDLTAEESAIGYGGNDVKDDLFGKVVDQTPSTPKASHHSSEDTHSMKQEDDTIVGVAEKADVDSDFEQGDELVDEESTLGGGLSVGARGSQLSFRLHAIEEKNLVDHVPDNKSARIRMDGSIVVLTDKASGPSKGEDSGTDGEENIMFGKVVDHTPITPRSPPKGSANLLISSSMRLEDDTVMGVAEKTETESYFDEETELADEDSTLGGGPSLEPRANGSISFRLDVIEEKNLVDHVPDLPPTTRGSSLRRKTDLSIMAMADNTSVSSRVDDAVIEGEKDFRFGRVIDKTPSVGPFSTRSIATDVATQNSDVYSGELLDYALDNTGGESIIGEVTDWDDQVEDNPEPKAPENHVVDHVPKRKAVRHKTDSSVRVMLDPNDDLTQVDTIAEDQEMDFGKIIDHVPLSTRSIAASMLTTGADADTRPDDDFDNSTLKGDNTTIGDFGGASTLGDGGWVEQDEDDALPIEEKHLVDHVPTEEGPISFDASMRVALNGNDDFTQVDTIAEDEEMDFGKIIDHVPLNEGITSARSTTGDSIGASFVAVGSDVRPDDDFDNTTVPGPLGSIVDELPASDNISTSNVLQPQTEESNLVDHVPQQTFPRPEDASIMVQADPLDVVAAEVVDDDENQDNRFGLIVDQTPLKNIDHASLTKTKQISTTIASDIAADIRDDDEMDATYFSFSTKGTTDEASVSNTDFDGITGESDSSSPEASQTMNESSVVVETVDSDSESDANVNVELLVSRKEGTVVQSLPDIDSNRGPSVPIGSNPFEAVSEDDKDATDDLGDDMQEYLADLARKHQDGKTDESHGVFC
jgi:hypothetical protein